MPQPQLARNDRQALLAQLAAKRKQQGTRQYAELEDSDDSDGGAPGGVSDDDSFATARSRAPVTLEDSSEDENDGSNGSGASSRPAAGGRLRRLHKAGGPALAPPAQPRQQRQLAAAPVITISDSDEDDLPGASGAADDDIAAQLGGLSIKGGAGGAGGSNRVQQGARSSGAGAVRAGHTPDSSGEDKCLVLGSSGQFKLNAKASCMLYPHQVEGVRWLWSLYSLGRGGILADDMGLGKTIQCAAFLAGLIENKLIRRAVVVAPKTLLAQWRKELGICGLGGAAHEYAGTANERSATLDRVVRRRGVLLTTYGMVLHNAEVLASHHSHDPDEGPMWDVMICDEGHKLKNPRMQLRKQLDAVPVGLRIIISGTPIQNNLSEMWALFNFVAPDVLGAAADFRDHYERVITNGSDKHATQYERERGAVAAARLRQDIGPYMLRREKKEVFKAADDAAAEASTAAEGAVSKHGGAKPASMPHKNDLIVWLKLEPMQRRVYQAFLNSDAVKSVFNQTSSALAAITVLKKVCDHPALLSERAAHGIISGANRARRRAEARLGGGGLSDSDVEEIEDSSEEEYESDSEDYSSDDDKARRRREQARQRKRQQQQAAAAKNKPAPPAGGAAGEEDWNVWASTELEQQLLDEVHTTGFEASCKTVFVMALLKTLVQEGHRTLIFSQSRVMLNILESSIKDEGWRFCRIDGSVASAAEREARVQQFQTSDSIPIFLLTSQVGGLGLTLTAADRVIIVDPAWNPSTDNQSVDRAYRIGQKRDVVVYRLISCGTVEEKIYRRQVFKGGLSRTGMEEGEQFRYFAQQDLRDLFRLEPSDCEQSATQQELHAMHAHQRRETPELRRHLQSLAKLGCYAGVSDHDLLFSKKEKEAPPASVAAQTQRPASRGAGGLAGGAGSVGVGPGTGSSPRKAVFGKTAAQGWSGGNELSDMFAKAVTISGGAGVRSSAAAAAASGAQPPGSGWAPGGGAGTWPAQLSSPTQRRLAAISQKDMLQERIEQLEEALERKRHLLTLSSGLADGGKKVQVQIVELEQELAEVKATAAAGTAGPPATATAAAATAPTAPTPAQGSAAASAPAAPPAKAPAAAAPTKPESRNALVAAAAAPLPSGKPAAVPAVVDSRSAPPPKPAGAPAAPPSSLSAPAAQPVPPGAKPAASPLFTRMRDMLWGGSTGEQQAGPSAGAASIGAGAAAAATSSGRALSFTGQGAGSTKPPAERQQGQAVQAPQQTGVTSQAAPQQAPFVQPTSRPAQQVPQGAHQGAQHAQQGAQQAQHGAQQAQVPKERSAKEVKAKLYDTLQAIKAAESGGYYDRREVERLRKRAARLHAEYQAAKAKAAQAGAAAPL